MLMARPTKTTRRKKKACACVCVWFAWERACAGVYVCMYVCTYLHICTHSHIYIYIYTYTYIHLHICIHVCSTTYTFACTQHVYIYSCTNTHIYIYNIVCYNMCSVRNCTCGAPRYAYGCIRTWMALAASFMRVGACMHVFLQQQPTGYGRNRKLHALDICVHACACVHTHT